MDLIDINRKVISLAQSVGAFIKEEGDNFDLSRIEKKTSFNNLVSYVDKEAEHRLVAGLSEIVPQAEFITEEGTIGQAKSKSGLKWIIDPLDGTTNFLHNLPLYAISIALVEGNTVLNGMVYQVQSRECFHAINGKGSFCNDKQIQVSSTAGLNESLLATGFPYDNENKSELHLSIIRQFLKSTHGIRRLGSAAIDLAYVACGRLDGFFEYNLNAWDVAAGVLILQEAGGKVTDFNGGDDYLFGRQLCASNTSIHDEMLRVIQQHWR